MGDLKPYFGVINYLVVQARSLLRNGVVANATRSRAKIMKRLTIKKAASQNCFRSHPTTYLDPVLKAPSVVGTDFVRVKVVQEPYKVDPLRETPTNAACRIVTALR